MHALAQRLTLAALALLMACSPGPSAPSVAPDRAPPPPSAGTPSASPEPAPAATRPSEVPTGPPAPTVGGPAIRPELIGAWVFSGYHGGSQHHTFRRAAALVDDKPGYRLLADGSLVRRQNVGWCGTPPIQYGNSPGRWRARPNGTLELSYGNWQGVVRERWTLVRLADDRLAIRVDQLGVDPHPIPLARPQPAAQVK